ncbi:hypothetical protein GC197_01690 [bacterium]|nr:hypothetical protein [bacterium]
MSVLRNLLIVGLLVCVGYNGYVIYRNQFAASPDQTSDKTDEAPLFSAEAFTELASNHSQISVQQPPTVVDPHDVQPAETDVANPVLETTQTSVPVIPVSHDAKMSRFSSDASSNEPPAEPPTPETPQPTPVEDITPKVLTFDDAWTEIEMSEAAFTWATALRQIAKLLKRDDLTPQQREQVLAKGDELAQTVIFANNKHLAMPAQTFLPGTNLEEIAANQKLPLPFLRMINGWTEEQNPTPGDSIKVLQGPVSLQVDLPTDSIQMTVGDLYAARVPIGQSKVKTPSDGQLIADQKDEKTRLSIGDVLVMMEDPTIEPVENSLQVSPKDWQLLRLLTGKDVEITWIENTPEPTESIAATPTTSAEITTEPAAPKEPIDALKMEVFAPRGKIVRGQAARYGIQVTNLSDKPSDLVQVVVNLSEGIEPLAVEGKPGRVAPGQALFDPVTIEAGESVRMTVSIETTNAGEFLVRPEVQCPQPATRYATELQLRVIEAESVSAEQQSDTPAASTAELPMNPAMGVR